jgi:hypothetical protein
VRGNHHALGQSDKKTVTHWTIEREKRNVPIVGQREREEMSHTIGHTVHILKSVHILVYYKLSLCATKSALIEHAIYIYSYIYYDEVLSFYILDIDAQSLEYVVSVQSLSFSEF